MRRRRFAVAVAALVLGGCGGGGPASSTASMPVLVLSVTPNPAVAVPNTALNAQTFSLAVSVVVALRETGGVSCTLDRIGIRYPPEIRSGTFGVATSEPSSNILSPRGTITFPMTHYFAEEYRGRSLAVTFHAECNDRNGNLVTAEQPVAFTL